VKTEEKLLSEAAPWLVPFHMSLDFLPQKTPIITPEKRTGQPGGAFENIAFEPGFEIVKSYSRLQSHST
jgi:hypothetical protein